MPPASGRWTSGHHHHHHHQAPPLAQQPHTHPASLRVPCKGSIFPLHPAVTACTLNARVMLFPVNRGRATTVHCLRLLEKAAGRLQAIERRSVRGRSLCRGAGPPAWHPMVVLAPVMMLPTTDKCQALAPRFMSLSVCWLAVLNDWSRGAPAIGCPRLYGSTSGM